MVDVYLGIGSNIDPKKNIAKARQLLTEAFPTIIFSRCFESEAIGFEGNNFINLVAKITLQELSCLRDEQINQLGVQLKGIENSLGRVTGGEKFSPRVMDIDVLLFGNWVTSQPVELPRDEILKNAYVLWPLSELAPDLIHPTEQTSYSVLWRNFDKTSQNLTPIDLSRIMVINYMYSERPPSTLITAPVV